MRNTDDASHYFRGYFDRNNYRSDSRAHGDVLIRMKVPLSRVSRVHQDCALRPAPEKSFTVMQPGIIAAKRSPSNQQQVTVRYLRRGVLAQKFLRHTFNVFDENF